MKLVQIKGQDKPIHILKKATQQGRLAHAYLFSGPDGVGKKTTAIALAQTLNCREQAGDACMECPSCRNIEKGQHPDVRLVEVKPDSKFIKIESIRGLQQEVACKSYEGRVKVQIIDQADKLTLQAANCLLKTLEEPPANSLLILVSAHPYNLLPTISSRCQHLAFKQLLLEDIEELLGDRGLSPSQCRLVGFFCQGSLAQALDVDPEQLLAEREQITKDIISRFPLSGVELLDIAQKLARDGEQVERLLKWLLLWYRDLLIINRTKMQAGLVNIDMWPELSRQAALFTLADLLGKLYTIEQTKCHLERNINAQLALETMFMDLNRGYCVRNNYETAA